MNIFFHIPAWILWTIGIIAGAGILLLAVAGVILLRAFGECCESMRHLF